MQVGRGTSRRAWQSRNSLIHIQKQARLDSEMLREDADVRHLRHAAIPGDVVLVRLPFTDLTSSKKRPALVLSPPQFSTQHGDIVVLALLTGRR